MRQVAFNLGPFSITWYSICILIGIIVATYIIEKESQKYNISSTFVMNLIFWCVIFGILGARIYYVLFNIDYYSAYPLEIVKIWNGGLAIHGGIIAGAITLIIYCKKYNINTLRMIDISVVGLIIGQSIGRWGNFFNMEAHGGIVTKSFLKSLCLPNFVIDGMYINDNYYHPTFFYESIFSLIGFIILLLIRRNKKIKIGNITGLYLIWYGIVRFFIECLRTDSLMIGNLKMAQVISILMIIGGVAMTIITSIKCDYYHKGQVIKNEHKK